MGLHAMISAKFYQSNDKKKVFISVDEIVKKNNKIYIKIINETLYREFKTKTVEILNKDILIIDYNMVFKNGYNFGKNL